MTRIRYAARTSEQLENREVKATSVGAWSKSLTAVFETDPEAIAAVLPPPLEPSDDPLVRVSIATVDIGRGLPPFGAGTFAVQARHGEIVGNYPLVMPMSTEQAVVAGRETYGEPKKLARIALTRDGSSITGTVERMGVTFIELRGQVTGEIEPPPDRERIDFYFKFLPAPDGKGFDTEPALVYCHREETTRSAEGVDGEILLKDSRFDPVADIPLGRLVEMTLFERRATQRGEIVGRVPAAEILPYMHQRYDDLSPTGSD